MIEMERLLANIDKVTEIKEKFAKSTSSFCYKGVEVDLTYDNKSGGNTLVVQTGQFKALFDKLTWGSAGCDNFL